MTSSLLIAPPPEVHAPVRTRPRLRPLCYEPLHHESSEHGFRWDEPAAALPPVPAPVPRVVASARADRATADPAEAEWREARRALTQLLRITLEVFDGRRPVDHVAAHLAPRVRRYLRVAVRDRRVRSASRFSRMRLCLPRGGVAEVAVTCEIDGQFRALAARFEHRRTGWCCTVLRLG
jgi:hypothetical protein